MDNCAWDFDNDGIIDSNEHNPTYNFILYVVPPVSLTVTNDIGTSTKTKIFELPLFSLLTDNFNAIDVGGYSTPTFTDLDSDGLLDMLVGEYGGYISLYEQNTVNATSFTLVTSSFNSIDAGFCSSPIFTDLDNDGLLDMLVGRNDGYISHYEQIIVNSTSFTLVTSAFNSINIGYNSSLAFSDLDGDSLLDMLIGESDGNINHYEQNAVEYSGAN